ncbi:hypothetical protein SAMN05421663_10964 [Terribacillus halophilus]|uniref:ABC-2 family transporter protein n=1 Tax=Terribacillus halophilus TaxID=361279 RepID=A0A1G6TVL7_9BACI|nr:hypothetical protein [Terribacillus halophilus]SDD32944.1 hypothetical protein SAMN05421663_10964 [Terribacillus halophilus]
MMKQIQALLYFFFIDSKRTITIFCSILLFIIIVLAAFSAGSDEMYIAITPPAYIFMAIFGFRTIQESLPFAIKRGATRKSYHTSVGIFTIGISFIMTTFLAAVQLLLHGVLQVASITNIHIIRPIHESTELTSILLSLPLDFAIMLFSFAAGLLLGIIVYKFGFLGGSVFGAIALVGITLSLTNQQRMIDLLDWVQNLSVLPAFGLIFAIACICYLISWFFIRTSTSIGQRAI